MVALFGKKIRINIPGDSHLMIILFHAMLNSSWIPCSCLASRFTLVSVSRKMTKLPECVKPGGGGTILEIKE